MSPEPESEPVGEADPVPAASEREAAGRDTVDVVTDRTSDRAPERRDGSRALEGGDGTRALTLRNAKAVLVGIPSFGKLLWRLVRDRRVSRVDRALFAAAVLYLFTPVDLIPDWLPGFGQLDDLVLVGLTLSRLLHRVDERVLLEHWEGATTSLESMAALLDRIADSLPWWARRLI